ncbi:GNAT family N-acetyltransferase [Allohahella sp. A8]|uniref:GNAT family N-acetyltransferase n=1 Tax=Allohahella sp. A8 TaxID=3141461 RepID=UPI000C0A5CE6|nr:GNAT family N-acetyltransferase [Hahellaceae bacterium]|tara:strand:+ start:1641 stop:2135 length:495 start_codon:yes stop_codon:yes gene_type:complete
MSSKKINIVDVDYDNPLQAEHLTALLDDYARDPMGGGVGLPEGVKQRLPSALADTPGAFSILAYVDDEPAGLTNCFPGFSTFKCKPIVNIHDITVKAAYRGLGLSQMMLNRVKALAESRGCCKLTLEVLSGNEVAAQAYRKFGFAAYELDPRQGQAQFWEMGLA